MPFDKIREPKVIPYYDQHKSLGKSLKNGGKSRDMHPVVYALRRFRNHILLLLAYITPINRIRITLHRWRGINIGKDVYIGLFCFFDNAYPEYIYIDDHASINAGSMIIAHFNLMEHFRDIITPTTEPVVIGEGAIVAVRSIILPGVVIGKKSIVSAGSVVNRSVPDYTLVAGNPAKKVTLLKVDNK
jgi:acetyltransferase-like isoleucine patch superfamily enzyme